MMAAKTYSFISVRCRKAASRRSQKMRPSSLKSSRDRRDPRLPTSFSFNLKFLQAFCLLPCQLLWRLGFGQLVGWKNDFLWQVGFFLLAIAHEPTIAIQAIL